MEKITLTKQILYYNQDKLINIATIEKQQYDSLEFAIEIMKNYNLKYIENKKGISAYEQLAITYRKNAETIHRYTKSINTDTHELFETGFTQDTPTAIERYDDLMKKEA